jgi:hypothetical protein
MTTPGDTPEKIHRIKLLCGTIIGAVLFFMISMFMQFAILADVCPDCGEPGRFFFFFYTLESDNGYNPFPSVYNFALTIIIGIFIGYKITRQLFKRTPLN